jgi:hypothetical protein
VDRRRCPSLNRPTRQAAFPPGSRRERNRRIVMFSQHEMEILIEAVLGFVISCVFPAEAGFFGEERCCSVRYVGGLAVVVMSRCRSASHPSAMGWEGNHGSGVVLIAPFVYLVGKPKIYQSRQSDIGWRESLNGIRFHFLLFPFVSYIHILHTYIYPVFCFVYPSICPPYPPTTLLPCPLSGTAQRMRNPI